MTEPQIIEPVRHAVVVSLDVQGAFDLFTAGFDRWWPREHHIGEQDMIKAVIEAREGGRVYEVGADGAECDWGTVLVWAPPDRLVVAWQLNGQWQYDSDLSHASEYEVNFSAEPGGGTLVNLEHRCFERHGEQGRGIQASVGGPGGWPDLLARFKATS